MRTIICCIIALSLIFCTTVPCFAVPAWSNTEVSHLLDTVDTVSSNIASVKTALTNIYNYITNNGNGIREGLLSIYNILNNNISTMNTNLSYSTNHLYNTYHFIVDNFSALAGDNLTISQQIYNLRNLTSAVGGQVADVSSKLLYANQYLTNIQTNTNNTKLRLDDIYNALYFTEVIPINTYMEYYFEGNPSSYSTAEYPYSDEAISGGYFYPVIPVLDTLIYDIYFPIPNNTLEVIDPYYRRAIYIWTSDDPDSNFSQNGGISSSYSHNVFTYEVTDNYLIFHYDLTEYQDNLNKDYFVLYHNSFDRYVSNITSNYADGETPFVVIRTNQSKSYFAEYKEQNDLIISLLQELDNNNSITYNDNDVTINVDIESSDGVLISRLLDKFKTFFNTGISLAEFLTALELMDQYQWFSPEAYTFTNTVSTEYTDLW